VEGDSALGGRSAAETSTIRPTLKDVAREANVSQKTASRVLNDERYVRPEVRDRVKEAILRLGYRSNDVARTLKLGTTRTIGLVIADISNPFYASCAQGVARVARRRGYSVVLSASDEGLQEEREYVELLVRQRIAGLLLVPAAGDHGYLSSERSRGLPIVALDRPLVGVDSDCVIVENEAGMRAMTAHLVAHGCRRIAILCGSPDIYTYGTRLQGYRRALKTAGIDERVRIINPTVEGATAATLELMSEPDPPDSICCVSNRVTVGVLAALVRLGVSVPDDLAVIGFDDFELSDVVRPRVTMVRQPAIELGMRAATLLIDRVEGLESGPPRTVTLPVKLMIRDSCGTHEPSAGVPAEAADAADAAEAECETGGQDGRDAQG
jgi:LacI family transcriptional regulator